MNNGMDRREFQKYSYVTGAFIIAGDAVSCLNNRGNYAKMRSR